MKSWLPPELPKLSSNGISPKVRNPLNGQAVEVSSGSLAQIYVCGITPYDATHIGHAATYLAFDTLNRALRDAGKLVRYVQNVTDVDDPLLERADATNTHWAKLASSQIDLFRSDMEALRVIPPDHYVGVVETVDLISKACKTLLERGVAYWVNSDNASPDLYFDIALAQQSGLWQLGEVCGLELGEMLILSAERGGDPDRPGKRDPLDPLLWRSARIGEPSWDSELGKGRPGWHIECSVIGAQFLEAPIQINGGGSDLAFPHHEFSAAHSALLLDRKWCDLYVRAGMVALDGEKMSKSRGNLVFVSDLLSKGEDPRAIRLAILDHRYSDDWEWTEDELVRARNRVNKWRRWTELGQASAESQIASQAVSTIRNCLADDLNTVAALDFIDQIAVSQQPPTAELIAAIDALLGINLI